ncbi:MAG: glycoside hydrolase family 18 [Bacteroidales bacterium]|nr:glycoside hydrolase family 18 [Bacteroidales bacterium]
MKRAITYIIPILFLAACSEWNNPEPLDTEIIFPEDQHPGIYARYYDNLKKYKSEEHFLVYATLHNSPEFAPDEGHFMRSLPDSLDIVSLTNADNFSKEDAEDMEAMRKVGTKVLYRLEYAAKKAELSGPAELEAYISNAIAKVREHGLDGWSFTGTYSPDDQEAAAASVLMVQKLYDAKKYSQLLVFEGNPLFVASDMRYMVDLFVLDTDKDSKTSEISMKIAEATKRSSIDASKIIIASIPGTVIKDADKKDCNSMDAIAEIACTAGPLKGICVSDITKDYYHAEGNYLNVRRTIQTLNPSR